MMPQPHLHLSSEDREQLQVLVRQHNVSRKVFQRAQALLDLDNGFTLQQAAVHVGSHYTRIAAWRNRYLQEGLAALEDRPRSGRPPRITGLQRAQITALACSTPPEGHARWSLYLLADQAVELGYVEAISHNHVRTILKKTP